MTRVHFMELHELAAFPRVWRDLLTDFMAFFARRFAPYEAVAERLWEAMKETGESSLLDLGSGAADSVLTVREAIERRHGVRVDVTLTDLYPNAGAFRRCHAGSSAGLRCISEPVDATRIPPELPGFRTLFSTFHHFRPEEARSILADAVRHRRGIAVFEYTERKLVLWGISALLTPVMVWLATPTFKPLTWRRLLWTYLLPVVPFVAAWDGFVSALRTYTPDELRELAAGADDTTFDWEVGHARSFGACHITYLIGIPRPARSSERGVGEPLMMEPAARPPGYGAPAPSRT